MVFVELIFLNLCWRVKVTQALCGILIKTLVFIGCQSIVNTGV